MKQFTDMNFHLGFYEFISVLLVIIGMVGTACWAIFKWYLKVSSERAKEKTLADDKRAEKMEEILLDINKTLIEIRSGIAMQGMQINMHTTDISEIKKEQKDLRQEFNSHKEAVYQRLSRHLNYNDQDEE